MILPALLLTLDKYRILTVLSSVCVCVCVCVCSGRGGERRHGESQTGQQEDPVQPAAGSCGSALSAVQPQKHGESSRQCCVTVVLCHKHTADRVLLL